MNKVIFVSGGARSGKSGYAVSLAERREGALYYIATATAGDEEMAERIAIHRNDRGPRWKTIEEPVKLVEALSGLPHGSTVLIDCLTLWLTNMLANVGKGEEERFQSSVREKVKLLAKSLKVFNGTVVVVTNEVGMGIVPDNALARSFRDVAGMVNRTIAEASDEAYFMVSGMAVKVK